MMRSLFAGVSGLKNHQTRMDVIGNNIANVNTVGFKKSRVTFQDMLSQTLRGASSPTTSRAGTNPMQVGLGMSLASIDVIHSAGSPQSTGKNTDLSIEGDGFFLVGEGGNTYYTRAGNFDFDFNKTLYNTSNGMIVKGIMADATGAVDPEGNIVDVNLSSQMSSPARATTSIDYTKNLDARTLTTDPAIKRSITIYDSLGASHDLSISFTNTATNTWEYEFTAPAGLTLTNLDGTISFNPDGSYNAGGSTIANLGITGAGIAAMTVTPDFSKMTQYADETTALAFSQDGYKNGDLQNLTVDTSGTITGSFSNGQSRKLAQLVTATFANPAGLEKIGNNLFRVTNNSGEADTGLPGSSGRGIIKPETLEMSNVDLSQEFVDMIVTQRGFQANSRVITTSDQILEELVNLRR